MDDGSNNNRFIANCYRVECISEIIFEIVNILCKYKQEFNLRPRQHDRQLVPKMSKIHDNNFIIRMLYKDVAYIDFIVLSMMRFVIVLLNEYEWMNDFVNRKPHFEANCHWEVM